MSEPVQCVSSESIPSLRQKIHKKDSRWPKYVLNTDDIKIVRMWAQQQGLGDEETRELLAARRRFKGRRYISNSRMSKKLLLEMIKGLQEGIEKYRNEAREARLEADILRETVIKLQEKIDLYIYK